MHLDFGIADGLSNFQTVDKTIIGRIFKAFLIERLSWSESVSVDPFESQWFHAGTRDRS